MSGLKDFFKKNKKEIRIVWSLIILSIMYLVGTPLPLILIFGAYLIAMFFLRGKMWKISEQVLETYLPFTKKLPDWLEKIILVSIFIIFLMILKNIIYFALGLIGIDLQQMLMDAMGIEELTK